MVTEIYFYSITNSTETIREEIRWEITTTYTYLQLHTEQVQYLKTSFVIHQRLTFQNVMVSVT